jgi:hypothetical protein
MLSITKLLLVCGFLICSAQGANVGINHGTYTQTGPFGPALNLLRSENVLIIKTFDITPAVLDAMEITYAQVCF